MKILINKVAMSIDKFSYFYMASEIPKTIKKESVVLSGDFNEIIDLKEETDFNKTFLAQCAENDGSHIKDLIENKKVDSPIVYKDYNTGEFTFINDPASSLETAWNIIDSPDTFYIYVKTTV